jgi:Coenzyme PQQ synthesis protein D (PqqD)
MDDDIWSKEERCMKDTDIIAIAPNATFQSLGDGAVILRTDSGQLFTCNETTEAFLKHVDGHRTLGAITSEILTEYEVDREMLTSDILALATDLATQGIIVTA